MCDAAMISRTTFCFTDRFKNFITLGGGHITAALFCGDPPILFDPGVSAFGPCYLAAITKNVARPESLIIALTHAHFDHCGAAAYLLRKIPTIRIAASTQAAAILRRPNAVELICRLNAEYEQSMATALHGEQVCFTALDVALPVGSGDSLAGRGKDYCTVLETPGHTRDSLSYLLSAAGVLVVGDAAGACENGFIHSPFLTSYEDYIASLERLQTLNPPALCVAHNGILAGGAVPGYLSAALSAAVAYKNMVVRYLDLFHGDPEKVVQRITAEEYDAQPAHIQKRQPFILNLTAKVNAVVRLLERRA